MIIVVELMIKGQWEYCDKFCIPRDYYLYSLITDMGSMQDKDLKPFIKNKKLPNDINSRTKEVMDLYDTNQTFLEDCEPDALIKYIWKNNKYHIFDKISNLDEYCEAGIVREMFYGEYESTGFRWLIGVSN